MPFRPFQEPFDPSHPFGGRSNASALLINLAAYWKADESSDGSGAVSRLDSGPNGLHLTDNNTTPSAAGLIGNCASFTAANSEYLSLNDNAHIRGGDRDWHIDGWINVPNVVGTKFALIKGNDTSQNLEYLIYLSGASLRVRVGDTTSASKEIVLGNITANTWNYVAIWFYAATNRLNVMLNGNTIQEAIIGTPVSTTYSYVVGVGKNNGSLTGYSTLLFDESGFWERYLTPAERSQRYNGGAGNTYPAFGGVSTLNPDIYGTMLYTSSIES